MLMACSLLITPRLLLKALYATQLFPTRFAAAFNPGVSIWRTMVTIYYILISLLRRAIGGRSKFTSSPSRVTMLKKRTNMAVGVPALSQILFA